MSTTHQKKWIHLPIIFLIACGGLACPSKSAPDASVPLAKVITLDAGMTQEDAAKIVAANLRPLEDQLGYEASHHPADTVTADQVFEAFKKGGIPIGSFQQSLGRMQKAAYCINAKTPEGMYVLICEYDTAEDLAAGKPITAKIFEAMPEPSQHVNKKTVLNLVRQSPEGAKQAETAVGIFEKL